jgi:subtilisin family serine protease
MRTRPGSNDEGETLVELIISVAIMGITVVALVGGVATTILMSDVHRKQATAGAYVRNYAEAVVAYVAAGHFDASLSPDYSAPTVLSPSTWASFTVDNPGFNSPVVSVQCWKDTTSKWVDCVAGSAAPQQVTLSVASADSRATESLVVVVRKPW